MKYLVLAFLSLSSLFALDFTLSNKTTSNARTQYIEFDKTKNINYEKLVIGKRAYSIFNHPTDKTKMYALIPISYYQKPTKRDVTIVYKLSGVSKTEQFSLKVEDGNYASEEIHVQKSKVNPKSEDVKKRVAAEYKEAMDIYGRVTRKNHIFSEFIMPMKSKITSDFGKARVYNNSLNGYHSGTDFRAKVGTPIVASNDGIVVLVKDRFYAGGTVILDHGQGVYTCYYHMSRFDVKYGEVVKKSQQIGLSGDSGRVTGPHLHFSARVGGVQVDPLQLIALLNDNIYNKTKEIK